MRESSTYQAILDEGRHEGDLRSLRGALLDLGTDKFGQVDTATAARIQQIDDVDTLNRLIRSVLRVGSWRELRELADRA